MMEPSRQRPTQTGPPPLQWRPRILSDGAMEHPSTHPTSTGELEPGRRRDELVATVALLRAKVIPARHLAAFIDQEGSAVLLLQGRARGPLPGHRPGQEARIPREDFEKSVRDVDAWLERGLDVRTVLDPAYPRALHSIYNRPPLLFVKGRWLEPEDFRAVAVVGTRGPSEEGVRRTRRLVRELAEARFTILSGLALGIDTVAHETALSVDARTVAVMGTGLDQLYPTSNEVLANRIVRAGGALLSQFLPHQGPAKWTFPERNIVMSGLVLATVVVEAGETSGSKMQAYAALEHGRAVFVLRSLVERHAWARRLVEQGAHGVHAAVVASPRDIIDAIDGIGDDLQALAV